MKCVYCIKVVEGSEVKRVDELLYEHTTQTHLETTAL